MPARSWDVWVGTQQAVEGRVIAVPEPLSAKRAGAGWSLQRVGFASVLATLALLACATSARADDQPGVAETASEQPGISALPASPAQPTLGDESESAVAPIDVIAVQTAETARGDPRGAATNAFVFASGEGPDVVAPAASSTVGPTERARIDVDESASAETETPMSQGLPTGGEAVAESSAVPGSGDVAESTTGEPGQEIVAGALIVSGDGLDAQAADVVATTQEPAPVATSADVGVSGPALETTPDAASVGVAAVVSDTPMVEVTVPDSVADALDQTVAPSPASTPAPASESAPPTEEFVAPAAALPEADSVFGSVVTVSDPPPDVAPPISVVEPVTPAPASESAPPTEEFVALVAALPEADSVFGSVVTVSDPPPDVAPPISVVEATPISVVEPVTPAPASESAPPTEEFVAPVAALPEADSVFGSVVTVSAPPPDVAPPISVVEPVEPAPASESAPPPNVAPPVSVVEIATPAPVPVAIGTIAPQAKAVAVAPASTPTGRRLQPPAEPATSDATTAAVEAATEVGPATGSVGTTSIGTATFIGAATVRRSVAPDDGPIPVAEAPNEAYVQALVSSRTSDKIVADPAATSVPLHAPDLFSGGQSSPGADVASVVVIGPVEKDPIPQETLPSAAPFATIEIVMSDGSTTGKVRPTAMQLRSISFSLGISVERLSGPDGAISIRIDRAGNVTVTNGSGTRFTPSSTAAAALISGVAAAVRFNSDAFDYKVVTAVDTGSLPRVPAPGLPVQTPVASGATWAPAGGSGHNGFGFGSGLGITMAAFATGVVVFRLGRRLGLTTEALLPVAFHSPLERPA